MQNKMVYIFFFFRRFLVKEPPHSENIFANKRYTSIVECVTTYTVGGVTFGVFVQWLAVARVSDPPPLFLSGRAVLDIIMKYNGPVKSCAAPKKNPYKK